MKADWCGFGAGEHARERQAVLDRAEAVTGLVGQDALAEVRRTLGAELLEQAGDEAAQRWSAQLLQSRDTRAQAVADYLDGSEPARARLQDRAHRTTDPMVTALALQRPCAAGTCANVDASQWSRLEPANIQAWLVLLNGRATQSQTGFVVDSLLAQAQYSRTYERETRDLVLGLAQVGTPGLQSEAELQRLSGVFVPRSAGSFRPILEACREGQVQAAVGMAARCEGLGDLLWQQSDVLHRSLALAFAGTALSARPERRALWERRARELEAVLGWMQEDLQRALARLIPENPAPAPCAIQVEAWQLVRESAYETDWERARAQMRAAQVDEAALAAAWRQREGRSALQRPRAGASAPAR